MGLIALDKMIMNILKLKLLVVKHKSEKLKENMIGILVAKMKANLKMMTMKMKKMMMMKRKMIKKIIRKMIKRKMIKRKMIVKQE
tara:strand:- start:127 stop:381 length:255 start_codon:yes stop_codon:yes gene_type:complete